MTCNPIGDLILSVVEVEKLHRSVNLKKLPDNESYKIFVSINYNNKIFETDKAPEITNVASQEGTGTVFPERVKFNHPTNPLG